MREAAGRGVVLHRGWPLADVRDRLVTGDLVPLFFDSRTWD